jgi:hypothetical protein
MRNLKSLLVDGLGIRGARSIASWAVAGGVAYYLWFLPEKQQAEERRVRGLHLWFIAVQAALLAPRRGLKPPPPPSHRRLPQIARELAKQTAIEQGLRELERVKPLPDPQVNGLIVGKGKK